MKYLILILLIFVIYLILNRKEKFTNCKNSKKGILSLECNSVPNFPRGLQPNQVVQNNCSNDFLGLTDKESKYTFRVPELRYDGIFVKDGCNWSLCCKKNKTYSSNNYFHIPPKCMYGKEIIGDTKCSYDKFMYSRNVNLKPHCIKK